MTKPQGVAGTSRLLPSEPLATRNSSIITRAVTLTKRRLRSRRQLQRMALIKLLAKFKFTTKQRRLVLKQFRNTAQMTMRYVRRGEDLEACTQLLKIELFLQRAEKYPAELLEGVKTALDVEPEIREHAQRIRIDDVPEDDLKALRRLGKRANLFDHLGRAQLRSKQAERARRLKGTERSAEVRGKRNIKRDCRIRKAFAAGKTPKQIAGDKKITGRKRLSASQVRRIVSRPSPTNDNAHEVSSCAPYQLRRG